MHALFLCDTGELFKQFATYAFASSVLLDPKPPDLSEAPWKDATRDHVYNTLRFSGQYDLVGFFQGSSEILRGSGFRCNRVEILVFSIPLNSR